MLESALSTISPLQGQSAGGNTPPTICVTVAGPWVKREGGASGGCKNLQLALATRFSFSNFSKRSFCPAAI